jgi:hypothetical protein
VEAVTTAADGGSGGARVGADPHGRAGGGRSPGHARSRTGAPGLGFGTVDGAAYRAADGVEGANGTNGSGGGGGGGGAGAIGACGASGGGGGAGGEHGTGGDGGTGGGGSFGLIVAGGAVSLDRVEIATRDGGAGGAGGSGGSGGAGGSGGSGRSRIPVSSAPAARGELVGVAETAAMAAGAGAVRRSGFSRSVPPTSPCSP